MELMITSPARHHGCYGRSTEESSLLRRRLSLVQLFLAKKVSAVYWTKVQYTAFAAFGYKDRIVNRRFKEGRVKSMKMITLRYARASDVEEVGPIETPGRPRHR
jgi:hypothetical protein